jgi:hypothetical protein
MLYHVIGYAKSIIFSEMFGPPLLRLKSFPVMHFVSANSQVLAGMPDGNQKINLAVSTKKIKLQSPFLGGIRHHLNFQGLVHKKMWTIRIFKNQFQDFSMIPPEKH